jgi:subtilase family serine protease
LGCAVAVVIAASVTSTGPAMSTPSATRHAKAACASPSSPTTATCHALIVVESDGKTAVTTAAPSGYAPADLSAAYGLPDPRVAPGTPWVWNHRTVAVIGAYDDPSIAGDLAAYRSTFGLPPCTTANGCFYKLNQSGKTSPLPAANVGWGQEMSLDVEMVSAMCSTCRIVLVEASSASLIDLPKAVNIAAALGADAISNSYGSIIELPSFLSPTFAPAYNKPGIAVVASSGDRGYAGSFPASLATVIAVGGTTLQRDGSARGWSETAWSGAGSWCSSYVSQPPWQAGTGVGDPSGTRCQKRTVADVSAVADPATGVAVYDTYGATGDPWYVFGGTSVSAPIIAALFARAGDAVKNPALPYPAAKLYANRASFNDVVSGSNGACWPTILTPTYVCNAGPGYDGPTGVGTPAGLAGL